MLDIDCSTAELLVAIASATSTHYVFITPGMERYKWIRWCVIARETICSGARMIASESMYPDILVTCISTSFFRELIFMK